MGAHDRGVLGVSRYQRECDAQPLRDFDRSQLRAANSNPVSTFVRYARPILAKVLPGVRYRTAAVRSWPHRPECRRNSATSNFTGTIKVAEATRRSKRRWGIRYRRATATRFPPKLLRLNRFSSQKCGDRPTFASG